VQSWEQSLCISPSPLHSPQLSNEYLIVEVINYSVLCCFYLHLPRTTFSWVTVIVIVEIVDYSVVSCSLFKTSLQPAHNTGRQETTKPFVVQSRKMTEMLFCTLRGISSLIEGHFTKLIFNIFMPVTRRVKGYTRFVGKYVTGRRKRFRPHTVYIFLIRITSRVDLAMSVCPSVRLSGWTLRSRKL